MLSTHHEKILDVLQGAVEKARRNHEGVPADYIPELARVDLEMLSAAVTCLDGATLTAGDTATHRFTFQSSAKLLLLAGLLEERGPVEVFRLVGSEPSGQDFASVARLETHGPRPANPLVNAGAIALAGQLKGTVENRVAWVLSWAERLYGTRIGIDDAVRVSESTSANRNRAIAYMLRHNGILDSDVEDTLAAYFALCSLAGGVKEAAHLPAVLAHGGRDPLSGRRLLSPATVAIVVSLMATCGMYNESGNYLVATGMPAKSGVSGVIVAAVPGVAGIAVCSPRLNDKGGSVRGHIVLRQLSRQLGWHFALASAELGAELETQTERSLAHPTFEADT
jgi:glutaminase